MSSSNVVVEDTRIVSLLIRAIESSTSNKLTLTEINQKLIELNPSLTQRQSDWMVSGKLTRWRRERRRDNADILSSQATVRHTLSMSTMFKKLNNARPAEWTIDPNGDRSTHKHRRKRQEPEKAPSKTSLKGKKRIVKRLGTTLRRSDTKSQLWPSKSIIVVNKELATGEIGGARSHVDSSSDRGGTIGCWTFSIDAPAGPQMNTEAGHVTAELLQQPRSLSGDFFIDDKSRLQVNKTSLPSQFIDTTREVFPPIPRLDTIQRVYSQSSSSISMSLSQSTSNQSQSQSQSQ